MACQSKEKVQSEENRTGYVWKGVSKKIREVCGGDVRFRSANSLHRGSFTVLVGRRIYFK